MRRISDNKIKDLQRDGKELLNKKGKSVKVVHKIDLATGRRIAEQKEKTAKDPIAEVVEKLAKSIDVAVKNTVNTMEAANLIINNVFTRLNEIREQPVDVKVDVKVPEPEKPKIVKCHKIDRDGGGNIKSFELRQIQ